MANELITAIRNMLGPKHYLALLVSLLSLTLLAPLVDHDLWTGIATSVFLILSLLTAGFAANKSKHMLSVSFFLAVLLSVMWVAAFSPNAPPFDTIEFKIASLVVTLLFFVTTGSIMWQDIFSGLPTTNRICGAVCLYILIGFCFAMLHLMVFLANPGAYKDTSSADKLPARRCQFSSRNHFPLFVYFSFCTLSTVGYGDIVPTSRLARTFSWLEALTGQLYLAILVARLVGMHIVRTKPEGLDDEIIIRDREPQSSRR